MPKVIPKPTMEELKAEKPTEQKGPVEMSADVADYKLTSEQAMSNPAIAELTKIAGVGPAMATRLYDAGYDLDAIGTGRARPTASSPPAWARPPTTARRCPPET